MSAGWGKLTLDRMKLKYLLVIEDAGSNLGAYFPDVPGCITLGDTVEEIRANALEALELHLAEEPEAPAPRGLDEHLLEGLELNGSETLVWIEYDHEKAHAMV
jgi:predicted RNase H-like HicB family nuclease